MNLENLVPSLADCKRIPEGAFKESALVWWAELTGSGYKWGVLRREAIHWDGEWIQREKPEHYPAPTLAEILAELPNGVHVFRDIVAYPLYGLKYENENLATAALRLWLELKGVQG